MNFKYILGLTLSAGLLMTAFNDDDIFVNTTPVIDASSVTTGSSDVTSTTAILYGTVKGLDDRSSASYKVGFNYITSPEALENVTAADLKLNIHGFFVFARRRHLP